MQAPLNKKIEKIIADPGSADALVGLTIKAIRNDQATSVTINGEEYELSPYGSGSTASIRSSIVTKENDKFSFTLSSDY